MISKQLICYLISILFFLAILSGFTACRESSKTQEGGSGLPERPNVVFIICDDLNDYPATFNGHSQAKTPNIDRLAKSGVTFINAHTNSPVCSPSRNSLFTGVYPHYSKDFVRTPSFEQPVLKHNKTLMEYFTENGTHKLIANIDIKRNATLIYSLPGIFIIMIIAGALLYRIF